MPDITYEIRAHIGTLSQSASGWQKELNLISWNEREPKYDLRDWSPDHQKMSKGITLTKEELLALKTLLNSIEI
ncbi:MAG: YdbC family protein [Anaerolineales bacterium]